MRWIGSSKKDLLSMPDAVQQIFGFALYNAQVGLLHPAAKPLKGFGSAGILEVVEDWGAPPTQRFIQCDSPEQCMSCIAFRSKRCMELRLQSWTSI